MSDKQLLIDYLRKSTGMRIAVLFGALFVFIILSSLIAFGIEQIPGLSPRNKGLIQAGIQCIIGFCAPALIVARYCSNTPIKWLNLTNVPSWRALLGVIIVYIIAMPAMEWIIMWNQNITFPEQLKGLEEILRNWETANEAVSNTLLSTDSVGGIIAGILIIGILTGFSEELFFRGGFQNIISKSGTKQSTAVWIAAIVFSAFHFQFFGFFPRLLLGAFFGFLLCWTGSLWPAIFAHAFNNSMVVIIAGITEKASYNVSAGEDYYDAGDLILPVISIALTFFFFIFCRKYFFINRKGLQQWQKNQFPPVSEN